MHTMEVSEQKFEPEFKPAIDDRRDSRITLNLTDKRNSKEELLLIKEEESFPTTKNVTHNENFFPEKMLRTQESGEQKQTKMRTEPSQQSLLSQRLLQEKVKQKNYQLVKQSSVTNLKFGKDALGIKGNAAYKQFLEKGLYSKEILSELSDVSKKSVHATSVLSLRKDRSQVKLGKDTLRSKTR